MPEALLAAALASLSVLVILRPLALGRARPVMPADTEAEARDRMLRQLRDLDEDLAANKLDPKDHARLREPVERAAAEMLRTHAIEATAPRARVEERTTSAPSAPGIPKGAERSADGRRRGWPVAAGAAAVVLAGLGVLLATSTTPRAPGATVTGDAAAGAPAPTDPAAESPSTAGATAATPEQLAVVDSAEAAVRRQPGDVRAHLALARAYAAAASPQLATIEYLAVTHMDATNPEANAALALVALAAGQAGQGKKMVDAALAAHPRHPEALYARGVVELMGLGEVTAGERDLRQYLTLAPFGGHRTTVETLLAMIPKGVTK